MLQDLDYSIILILVSILETFGLSCKTLYHYFNLWVNV